MFLFPLLKNENRRLRVIARVVAAGLFILLTGLWIVQIVCANRFESNSKRQSLRRVGIPAIRGRILDCNGQALADDKPHYNAVLYLEDLQAQFHQAYTNLSKAYRRPGASRPPRIALQLQADCQVVSNIVFQVRTSLADPGPLNTNAFLRHYTNYPYVPYDIVPNMLPRQVARFAEQLSGQPDLDIEMQPVRDYPNDALAAHVIGYVQRGGMPVTEQISYTLPDYEGQTGIEHKFDSVLRGQPGTKLVLVNSRNYRQREDIETPNAPGDDVYLTIDLEVQRAAERALSRIRPDVRGAVVVLDVRNGDILAMVSMPEFDPNSYVAGLTPQDLTALDDPKMTPQINRAIDGAYPPGSTFKIITGLACLENGLDPNEIFDSPGEFRSSPNARPIRDTAGAGKFTFERAFFLSSNTYFINYGVAKAGLRKILEVARRFYLGEKTGMDSVLGPEVAGNIPDPGEIKPLPHFSVPDVCIGQEVTTTPVQLAGMISAIANGGTIYWPRLVARIYSPDTGTTQEFAAPGRVRGTVKIDPRNLEIIRRAMLDDTEHAPDAMGKGGTAYAGFHERGGPDLGNFHVAGKTGTAEVKSTSPNSPHKITWFASYGPFESPRYAVIVMVEDGASGGACSPAAKEIYAALIKREQARSQPAKTLARN